MRNERQARIEGAEKHIPIMEQGTRGHAISHSTCNIGQKKWSGSGLTIDI